MPTARLCSKALISERTVKGNHTFRQGSLQDTSLTYLCIFKQFDIRMGWRRKYDPLLSPWLRAENFISVFTGVWVCEFEDVPLPRQPCSPELQCQEPWCPLLLLSKSFFPHHLPGVSNVDSVSTRLCEITEYLGCVTSKAKTWYMQSDARLENLNMFLLMAC